MSNRSVVDRVRGAGMRALAAGLALSSAGLAGTPPTLRGDLNCDGFITIADISPFVLLLLDPAGYAGAFPECDPASGDTNQDGFVTVGDIGSFVNLLTETAGPLFPGEVVFVGGDELHDFDQDGYLDFLSFERGGPSSGLITVAFGDRFGQYKTVLSSPIPFLPYGVTVADFNQDAVLDVAAVNFFGNEIVVLLGDGTGIFSPWRTLALSDSPEFVQVGDCDADGFTDLFTICSTRDKFFLHRGRPGGEFDPEQLILIPYTPYSFQVADVDNDLDSDVLLDGVTILFSAGVGTFLTAPTGVPFRVNVTAFGDVNQDGNLDFVATDINGVLLATGNGAGGFELDSSPTVLLNSPYTAVTVDMQDDGREDLVVLDGNSQLWVYPNGGGGQFDVGVEYPTIRDSIFLATGDVDADGDLDAVVTGGGLLPLLNRGNGALTTRRMLYQGLLGGRMNLADLDADGDLDVACQAANTWQPVALFGDGAGGFAAPVVLGPPIPFASSGAVVADVNGDGLSDLVDTNWDANSIVVLLGVGGGLFDAPLLTPLAPEAAGTPFSGDFNNDGFADILMWNTGTGINAVYLSDGSGGFAQGLALPSVLNDIVLADFDSDGNLDLAAAGLFPSVVQTWKGLGNGTFGPPTEIELPPSDDTFVGLAAGDLNGDGLVDLATVGRPGLAVLLGDGTGNFPSTMLSPGPSGTPVAVVDIDLDGRADVIGLDVGNEAISVLFGSGDGKFRDTKFYASSGMIGPLEFGMGDIDGDGDNDLVMRPFAAEGVQILENWRFR
ncbi:MAG: VCBS repeat-containing protein [Phycisphaerae bacterium]|nr:VCBS repeat-containing protein [Phycisphaerae bacterium]